MRAAMLAELPRHAIDALRANPLRSLLTILSVVAGVAAVIAMTTLGHGVSRKVETEINKLGVGVLTLRVGQRARGGKGASIEAQAFDYADVEAIRSSVRHVQSVVPLVSRKARVVSGRHNLMTTLLGTESDYFAARAWSVAEGRAFTAHEMHVGAAACIIGETIRTQFFQGGEALGALLRLGTVPCTVIGVLAPRGQSGEEDSDNIVAIPFDAYQRRVQGSPDIGTIVVTAVGGKVTPAQKDALEALMRERRRLDPFEPSDFTLLDMRQIAEASAATARMMTSLLGTIAVLMLLVGGLGITNVMLVSVAERRREIAIRMAIGALPGHILGQFLIEAVALSTIGSVFGTLVGVGSAVFLAPLLQVPFVLDADVVWVSFAMALAIGVTFGFAPARRAARLDPISGLRAA
jgi:putative ABC transport system permease protein